jgi:aminopeptidase YwaD
MSSADDFAYTTGFFLIKYVIECREKLACSTSIGLCWTSEFTMICSLQSAPIVYIGMFVEVFSSMPDKKHKILPLVFVSFVLLCSPAAFSQRNSYLLPSKYLESIQNEVSGERAWDLVSKISRFHRIRGAGKGSDYDRCVEWLAEELRKIGLQDIQINKYAADGFKKYFLWDSLVGWKVQEAELWLVEPEKKLISRFSDQAVSLMPYSQGKEIEADVIFVGQGKSAADYENKNVADKIVFALGGGGAQVHREAVLNRGAAGIVVGPSNRLERLQFPDLIEVNRLSPSGEERDKTGFGFSLSRRQEQELLSYFKRGRTVRMRAKVEAVLFDGTMPVLEAKIPGKDFPGQEIIIVAHLDHYKPGANDNASGSAGMAEMARNILALIERGEIPYLRRTIRFLWVPEMHGTIAYLTEHQDLGQKGIAGLNLDMIGEDYALCQSSFNLTRAPYSVPGYINDVVSNFLPWLESSDFFAPTGNRHLFHGLIKPYSGGSDHVMLNDGAFAIPTPMLGHGDVFHHTNFDTPDKCDPTEMKRITSLALASTLLMAIADDQDALNIAREVFSRACSRITERSNTSIKLIHEYAKLPEKRSILPEIYSNISRYPAVLAQIEKANLGEIKELCQEDRTKKIIDEIAKALDNQARTEYEKIDYAHGLYLYHYGIDEEKFRPGEFYRRSAVVFPERHFKGPLPSSGLSEMASEDFRDWLAENREKIGPYFGSKQYEIVNLMNGQRSLLRIRDIVSCEFDETDIEFVFRFAQELEKMGLISFKIGRT